MDGSLSVTVSKQGFNITGSPKTVSVYGNGGISLVENQWANGELTEGSIVDWYKITVTDGTTYYVWWYDRWEGLDPRNKSADVKVGAWYSYGSELFPLTDNGWNNAQSFLAGDNATVYVKVMPYSETAVGTYGVVFSTGSTRPE
jgi:hypothetical protein